MALEAVVFPQDSFIIQSREYYSMAGDTPWSFNGGLGEEEESKARVPECAVSDRATATGGGTASMEMYGEPGKRSFLDDLQVGWDPSCSPLVVQNLDDWDVNSSPETQVNDAGAVATTEAAAAVADAATTGGGRRKRRRTKTCKNKEEVENQRMTHIAVERNRRKQMNEYLAVLRSLMPASYVQRGDQASIIGGAINFVKELEQLLQSLEAQKRIKQRTPAAAPFSDFFTFPQYSTSRTTLTTSSPGEAVAENRSAIADIEVTMVESHANLKILSRRRPKQLLKVVAGLQNHHLTALHLNVTTIDQMVLYSFSLKVEDDCQLTSVDDIAAAVHQMLGKIQEEHDCDDQMGNGP